MRLSENRAQMPLEGLVRPFGGVPLARYPSNAFALPLRSRFTHPCDSPPFIFP